MAEIIDGIKLIQHNMGGVNNADDPSFGPFLLHIILRVPSFMEVTALFIYGREEIIVRGQTREALEQFLVLNELRTNPRLQKIEISFTEVLYAG